MRLASSDRNHEVRSRLASCRLHHVTRRSSVSRSLPREIAQASATWLFVFLELSNGLAAAVHSHSPAVRHYPMSYGYTSRGRGLLRSRLGKLRGCGNEARLLYPFYQFIELVQHLFSARLVVRRSASPTRTPLLKCDGTEARDLARCAFVNVNDFHRIERLDIHDVATSTAGEISPGDGVNAQNVFAKVLSVLSSVRSVGNCSLTALPLLCPRVRPYETHGGGRAHRHGGNKHRHGGRRARSGTGAKRLRI